MSLYDFWFSHEDLWFNCSQSDDQQILSNFYFLLNLNTNPKSKTELIECIILYDQLVRHFYRGKELPKIYSDIAILYSRKIIESKLLDKCQPQELCFILLPYRHLKTINHIEFCLDILNIYMSHNINNKYFQRFYRASIRSLSELKTNQQLLFTSSSIDKFNLRILDVHCTFDINNPFYQTKLTGDLINSFKKLPKQTYTLSVSGGVDSMVCSYILFKLKIPFIGFIINYSNRDSSNDEVNMVRYWFGILEIPLYVRKIDEIVREKSDRQFYEKHTNDIRFNCYKKLNNPIILGHNRDDKMENIIANINKCQNYDNLYGMEYKSLINNVEVYRCMLDIHKSEIIEFAQQMKIPYVYDSTPDWSFRGKTRDKIIPAIKSVDENILYGLEDLSENLRDVMELIDTIISNIKFDVKESSLSFSRQNNKSFIFWQKVFKIINEKYGYPIFSKKSIKNFISHLDRAKSKVRMCKICECVIDKSDIFLFI
tara:strand:+ start:211 stop:1662 length:1452 start_codon:yes stop_codon:yes gene_type:complete